MFRRVFVPLDGSRLAESALPAAVELARHLGARVTVFHALERSAPATVHGERHLTAEGEARAYLAEVASWVAQRGITVETQLETEALDAAASIASKAGGEGADLVVTALDLIAVDDAILEDAARLEPTALRTLDAIHLASALALGEALGAVVTYDTRLETGARAAGLATVTPR